MSVWNGDEKPALRSLCLAQSLSPTNRTPWLSECLLTDRLTDQMQNDLPEGGIKQRCWAAQGRRNGPGTRGPGTRDQGTRDQGTRDQVPGTRDRGTKDWGIRGPGD